MKSLGIPELLIVLVIVILIFGVGRLPQIGRGLGQAIHDFRASLAGKDTGEGKTKAGNGGDSA